MGEVTVQVRNLDADVHEQLRKAARQAGLSLSEFLRRELTALAMSREVRARAEALRGRNALGGPFPELEKIPLEEWVGLIREDRDGR